MELRYECRAYGCDANIFLFKQYNYVNWRWLFKFVLEFGLNVICWCFNMIKLNISFKTFCFRLSHSEISVAVCQVLWSVSTGFLSNTSSDGVVVAAHYTRRERYFTVTVFWLVRINVIYSSGLLVLANLCFSPCQWQMRFDRSNCGP